jgi:hypothetical protein
MLACSIHIEPTPEAALKKMAGLLAARRATTAGNP